MSVSNEVKRLKRRVRKSQGKLDPALHAQWRAALLERIARQMQGEDVSAYEMPPCPFPEGYATGARERLATRIIDISERRQKAEEREKRRALEQNGDRPAFDESIRERMNAIDAETKGDATRAPFVPMVTNERANPIIGVVRRRMSSQGFAEEEEGEHERND